MIAARAWPPRTTLALVLIFALASDPESQEAEGLPGSAWMELGSGEISARLGFEPGGASGFGLRLDADAEAAEARAFVELGSDRAGRPFLAAGPGTPAGALRFVLDPTSPATLSPGLPIVVDRGMESGRAALRVGAGLVQSFAIAEAEGPLFSARLSGLKAEETTAESGPSGAAVGLALGGAYSGGEWSALVDASSRASEEGGEGWSPEPRPDRGGTVFHAAIVARRSTGSGDAGAAIAASAGALEGSGLAARVQAAGRIGPVSLNASFGAASAAYRDLFGSPPDDLVRGKVEARFALRRSSSISISREAYAERDGELTAPSWGHSDSIAFRIAVREGLSCALAGALLREPPDRDALAAARPGDSSGKLALSVSRRVDEAASPRAGARAVGTTRSKAEAALRWKDEGAGGRLDGLDLAVSFRRDNGAGWPSLGLDLKAGLMGEGDPLAVPIVYGRLGIGVPLGSSRELSLEVSLPSGGVALALLPKGAAAPAAEVSIGYRASFPSR